MIFKGKKSKESGTVQSGPAFVGSNYDSNLETLEVHEMGASTSPHYQEPRAPDFRSIPFSRRKAIVVSSVLTGVVLLFTGVSSVFFTRTDKNRGENPVELTTDLTLKSDEKFGVPDELQGSEESLVIKGDLITQGVIKISNDGNVMIVQATNLTANRTFNLPDVSGTFCTDANNCNYADLDQLGQLNNQVAQLGQQLSDFELIADSGVTSVNNQTGVVAIQGSTNRIQVNTAGGVITLSTPQELDANANVQFGSLAVSAAGTITANNFAQTGVGNDVSISAGNDAIVFTAGGRSFQLPVSGPGTQTICTDGALCATGAGEAVLLSDGAAQSDTDADASIFINDTGGGHLIRLQSAGVDRLAVDNLGNTTVGGSLTVSALGNGFVRSTAGALSVVSAIDLASSDVTNTLPVNRGGTGASSLTANGVLVGNGTSPVSSIAAGGSGLCLVSTAGAPTFTTCPGVSSLNGQSGSLTLQGTANQVSVSTAAGVITLSTPQDINTSSSPTFAALTLSGLSNGVVRASAGTLTTGLVSLTAEVSGTLPVGNGGTGTATTPTNGQLLIGNGTNYTLATLSQGAGTVITNGAGSITIASAFGSSVDLGSETSGDFVATISGGGGVNITGGTGAGSTPSVSLVLQANKGLEVDGNGLSLIDCGLNQILKYSGSNQWACAADETGSFTVAGDSGTSQSVTNGDTVTIQGGTNISTSAGATDTITINTVNNPTFTTSVTTPLLQSSGALSITPNGALTVGATGQTALLQGSTTTITSNGIGNDIVLSSADQIRFSGFDCTAFANGGTLTTDASGNISCTDDNGAAANTITGTGTANRIALYTGAQTIADSWLLQNGSTLELDNTRNLSLNGGNFSVTGTGLFTGLLTANGGLTIETGDTFTFNGEAFTDLTGTGLEFSSGSLQTSLGTSVDLTTEVIGILPVANGGTGVNGSTAANGTLLIGNGTGFTVATLTAGSGITVNNSAGGIEVVNVFGTSIESGEITDLTISNADIANGTIDISTKTTGNFVATVSGSSQISVSGSGSNNAAVTLGIVADSIGDTQLAFDTGQNLTTTSSPSFNGLTLSGNLTVQGGNASIGTATQAGSLTLSDGSSNTGALQTAGLGQNTTFTLPDPGAVTATICLDTGNCAGVGGGVTTAGGTANRIAIFNGAQTIADSWLLQNGSTLQLDNTRNLELIGGNLTLASGNLSITGNQTTSGTVTFSGLANGFLEVNGTGVVSVGTIDLGADTTGNYVATITAGNGISGTSNTEGGTPTIALSNLTADWIQSGAFDIVLGNAGSEIRILESVGGTFYGTFDVGDLSADQTYIFLQGGDVLTSGNVSSYATTGVTAGNGLTGGGTTGLLTVNIGAGNGIQINADDIAVVYGSTANTAVEGDTQITVTAGTNLTGGGTITLGAGGSLTVNVADSPTFAGNVTVQGGSVTVGTATQAGTVGLSDGSSNTGTLQTNPLAQNTAFNLPDPGQASADICLSTGNCAGAGGGVTTAGGTANRIAMFNGGQTIADSWLLQNGSTLQLDNTRNLELIGGNLTLTSGNLSVAGNQTTSGTVTFSALANGFLEVNGSGVVSVGTIDLGTDTTGNYVATITAGNGISGTATGEGSTPTIALGNLTADWVQSGAFDIVLDNSGAEVRIRESNGTFYGLFDVGDLTADQTYTFLQGGTVVTSGNVSTYATTGVTAGSGLAGGGTTGVLTVNIGAGNGIQVNADDIAVIYGSTANTAVQGNTQITVTAGTNLTGGGTITLGAGGSLTVNVADSPTFAGAVNVQGATLTIGTGTQQGSLVLNDGSTNTGTLQTAALGQNTAFTLPDPGQAAADICLSTGNCAGAGNGITGSGTQNSVAKFGAGGDSITDSTLTDDGTNVTTSVDLIVQGGSATIGTALQNGALTLYGNGFTGQISGTFTSNRAFTLPDGAGEFCIKELGNCSGSGGGNAPENAQYLVLALDAGLSAERTLSFNSTNFTVVDNGANNSYTVNTAQNIATTSAPSFAGLTLTGNLNLNANTIQGTTAVIDFNNFDVASTGAVTAGTYNGQTISSSASFTGTLTVAGLTTLNGGLNIEAGDTLTFNGDAFTDLTGNGLQVTTNVLTLAIQANKGLEVDANGLSLIDCVSGEILKYNGSNQWACATDTDTDTDTGDEVSVNGVSATNVNFINVTATGTAAGTSWSLNTGATPNEVTLTVSNASATEAGVVTTGTQVFAGDKTFNGSVTVAAQQTIRLVGDTTAQRPASPTEGMMYFDTTTKQLVVYANGKWQADSVDSVIVAASNSTQAQKDSADYVADGTADQTEINAALTEATGGRVFLLPGTYTVNASIVIPSNTTLAGSGAGTILTIPNAHDVAINIVANSDTVGGNEGIVIRDLKIDGNRDNNTAGDQRGINFTNVGSLTVKGATIENLVVQNMRNSAIYLNDVINSSVSKNTVINSAFGIYLSASIQNTIQDNKLLDNYWPLQLYSASSENMISNNTVYSGEAGGIYFSNSDYNLVQDNSIKGTETGSSVHVFQSDGTTVGGNNIEGGDYGINLRESNNTTVTANTIVSAATMGIYVDVSNDNTVSSNKVNGTTTFGIYLGLANRNTLANNHVDGTSNNMTVASSSSYNIVTGNVLVNSVSSNLVIGDNSSYNTASNNVVRNSGTNGILISTTGTNLNNNIIGNTITDTAGTSYGINIAASTNSNTYLADNTFGAGAQGVWTAPIQDLGTNTIYGGQVNGAGNYVIEPGAGTIELQANTNVTGTLIVSGLITANGGLTVEAGDTFTVNGDGFTDLTGNGLMNSSGALTIAVQASKGLEADANGLSLIDCVSGEILKYNGSNQWACASDAGAAGTGDSVQVNSSDADGANFIDSAASATNVAVTWTLDGVASPDTISLALGTASGSDAGIVSANAQTFGGAKTFNGQIVAGAGIDLGTQTLQGTTAIINFTNFDVDASGNTTVAGNLTVDADSFVVNSTTNRIGLGIASPTARFDVLGNSAISSGAVTMTAANGATTFTTSAPITLNAGDWISPDTTSAQSRVVSVGGTGTNFTVNPAFSGTVTGETFTIYPAVARFANSAGVPVLTVRNGVSSGRVGIGTDAPREALDVNGNIGVSSNIYLGRDNPSANTINMGGTSINILNAGEPNVGILFQTSDGDFSFKSNGSGGNYDTLNLSASTGAADFRAITDGVNRLNLRNAANTIVFGVSSSDGSITSGAAALQGSLIINDGSGQTGTLSVANLAANRTYTLPEYTSGTGTICLDNGNCAGAGAGVTATSGTAGRLAVFDAAQNITSSWFLQNSSTLELDNTRNLSLLGGNLSVTGNGTFTGNLTVDTNTLFVDATNNRVGIGTTTPGTSLSVEGGNTGSGFRVGDLSGLNRYIQLGYQNAGNAFTSGAVNTGYIGGTVEYMQVNKSLGVTTTGAGFIGMAIQGATSQTADLFQLRDVNRNILSGFNAAGNLFYTNSGFTSTIETGVLGANRTLTIPGGSVNDTFCLQTLANCSGSATTLQASYNADVDGGGAIIATTDADGDIIFNLADTTTDASFTVNIQGTGNQFRVQDGGTSFFTASDGRNIAYAGGNAGQFTLSSDLVGGARSTYPMVISQANDATNNNSVGLLQLNNQDTGSTAAVLNITQVAGGTGISLSGITGGTGVLASNTTGTAFSASTVTTGTGLNASGVTAGNALFIGGTAFTTGNGFVFNTTSNAVTTGNAIDITGAAGGITADLSGHYINVTPTRTLTAAATRTDSASFLNLSRANTVNNASGVYNVTGALANLQSNCTQTSGTCTDTANILALNQQYANASGAVMNVLGAGTGNLATFDASNASANGISVDVQSSSSSQFAFRVTSNNGATNGLYVRADGNVGIGTTTPARTFEVSGSDNVARFTSSGVNAFIELRNSGSGANISAVSSTGDDIGLWTSGGKRLTINSSGNSTFSGTLAVQGASVTIGAAALQGSLILHDGNGGQTAAIQLGNIAANTTLTLPASLSSSDIFCFQNLGNCSGSATTLQASYNADVDGSDAVIGLTSADGAVIIRDNATPLGSTLFAVQNSAGTTSYLNVSATGVTVAGTISVPGAGTNSERFGAGTISSGTNSLAIGNSATTASFTHAIAIGQSADVSDNYGTSIGWNAAAAGNSVALGNQANAAAGAISIGGNSTASSGNGVAIGLSSSVSGNGSLALGASAAASNFHSIALGASATASHVGSIALGESSVTTSANQLVVGSSATNKQITNGYFGNGVTAASPQGFTLNATGGSGTDIAGANLIFAGGRGTGTGVGGDIILQTAAAGSTGTSLNALTERLRVTSAGQVRIGGSLTTADSLAKLAINTGATSNKGLVIQGIAGQTADYFQAQDSTGAVQFKVEADGSITGNPGGCNDVYKLGYNGGNTRLFMTNFNCQTLTLGSTGANSYGLSTGSNFDISGGQLSLASTAATSMYLSTNATLRMEIQSDGDIAMDTNTLFVDAVNNRVGIGTATPDSTLNVNGTAKLLGGSLLAFNNAANDAFGAILNNGGAGVSQLALQAGGSTRLTVLSTGTVQFNGYNCTTFANGGVLTTDASGNITCADDDGGAGGGSTLQAAYDADVDGSDAIITLTAADGGILFRDASTPLGTTLFAVQDNTGATGYLTVSAATTTVGNNLTVTGSGTFNGNVTVGDASSDTLTVAATSTFNAAVTVNATQTINAGSTTAFTVNNATSGEVFSVNTTNSQITVNGQNQEDITGWTGSTAIPWARQDAASAVYNGYIYSTGGAQGVLNTPESNMSRAKINPDGSLGSWSSDAMLGARQEHIAIAYNGFLYIIGGNSADAGFSPNAQNNVWVGKINPDDGNVGAGMRGLTALPSGLRLSRGLAYNGYLYVIGGNNGSVTVATVYYAKVLSDGSLGTWNTTTAGLPAARQSHDVVVANGRMYVIGGFNGSAQSSVYFGTIGSDGNITAWTTATNSLPAARADHASFVMNGYLYVTGGGSSGATSTVYFSKINSSTGQPDAWATSTALPASRLGHNVEVYNGYVYLLGGSYTTNTYYGSGSRTRVAGALDLTSIGGSDVLSANGMAGILSAGDTNVLGDLRVTQSSLFLGDANFANDVIIDSPDAQLMVVNKNSGGLVTPLKLHNDTSTTGSKVAIDFGVSAVYNTTTAQIGVERMSGGAGDIYFSNYSGSALVETMRIQSDGDLAVDTNTLFVDAVNNRLGVGTATPQATLHVVGSVRFADFASCTALETDAEGDLVCGTDDGGAGSSSSGVAGAIQFSDGAGGFSSDATNFFWDDTNDRLGLGTATPQGNFHVSSATDVMARIGTTDTAGSDATLQLREGNGVGGEAEQYGFNLHYEGNDNKFFLQALNGGAAANVMEVDRTDGEVLIQAVTDAAETFQVARQDGFEVLNVNTTNAGNVTVGVVPPTQTAKLFVSTGGFSQTVLQLNGEHATGRKAQIMFSSSTAGGNAPTNNFSLGVDSANNGTNDFFIWDERADAGSGEFRFRINSDGTINLNDPTANSFEEELVIAESDTSTDTGIILRHNASNRTFRIINDGSDEHSLDFDVESTTVFKLLGPNGNALFQNATDSTSGFQVLDADGGVPVFNVDTSNEYVGIGTATPGSKLHLFEAGNAALNLQMQRSNNAYDLSTTYTPSGVLGASNVQWYTGMYSNENSYSIWSWNGTSAGRALNISNTSNVGIGVISPEFKLQVAGAGNNFVSNDAYAGIAVYQGRRANGTQAVPTALGTNEVITQLSARGHDGTAFSGTRAAITLQTIGAWTGSSHGTAIRFQVTDSNSTTLVQQAGLNSDGSFVIANSDTDSQSSRLRVVAHSASTVGTIIQGTSTQTADLLKLKRDTLDVLTVAGTGTVVMRNSANSTDAFQVQNASSQRVLGVNTTAGEVNLGSGSTLTGRLVVHNSTNNNTVTLTVGATSASYTLTLPTSVGSANQCLQNSGTPGVLTWGTCGGSGSSTKTVKVLAEYAGGILSADGTSNTGTMSANHDSTARRNYYEWTTTQATAQDYDVVATVQVPSDFASIGAASGFKFYIYDGDGSTTTAKVTWTVVDGSGTQCFSSDFNGTAANTWEQKSASTLGSCSFTANSEVTFRFKLTTTSGAGSIRIGGFEYQYSN